MAGFGTLTEAAIQAGIQNAIQKARIRRTRYFFENREGFMRDLVSDITKACRVAKAKGYTPVFRLNGTSDIRWETVRCERNVPALASSFLNVFDAFPEVQFYDYTKLPNRKGIPANYSLTFSLAENNDTQAMQALVNGMNVAAVFRNKATVSRHVSEGFKLYWPDHEGRVCVTSLPVFVGDDTDLRFLDPKGHIIALYAKGNAKKDTSGFVRD